MKEEHDSRVGEKVVMNFKCGEQVELKGKKFRTGTFLWRIEKDRETGGQCNLWLATAIWILQREVLISG